MHGATQTLNRSVKRRENVESFKLGRNYLDSEESTIYFLL
jgi:hypothetical protein